MRLFKRRDPKKGWNYRVVRQAGELHGLPWEYFAIHEAYYSPRGVSITENPADVGSEEKKDLPKILKMMARACRKPVLDYSAFRSTPNKRHSHP